MELWVMTVIDILSILIAFLLGMWYQRRGEDTVGLMAIDPVDPEINGGVYTVWDKNPHELVKSGILKDGQVIRMQLAIKPIAQMSQSKQGIE